MLCLMGLNMSNSQIAAALELDPDVAHIMTMTLRQEICARKPGCKLKGTVECDEVYVRAGHKGHPEAVRRKNRPGRRRGLKGAPGRSTLEKEKPPILGIIERSGDVAIFMLPDVQRKTIEGFWSLLRSWLRPHRGISQENLPRYLGLFGFVHNIHRRGKALLAPLLNLLVAPAV
jgi:hypothetical protein